MGLKSGVRLIRSEPRNYILFEHPKRESRKLRFHRLGKRIYARGGVWGDNDWFEAILPEEEALQRLNALRKSYLRSSFTIKRSRVYVSRFAEALDQPLAKRTRVARSSKPTNEKYLAAVAELLKTKTPTNFDTFKAEISALRELWHKPLNREFRSKLSAHLELRLRQLATFAAGDKAIAARARHVLPPGYLHKP